MAEQVGHLDRRRLARERQQPIARGVPCQIDQYVDAIAPDPFGQIGVAQADRAVPVIGEGAEPLGDSVRRRQPRRSSAPRWRNGHALASRGSANNATACWRKSGET